MHIGILGGGFTGCLLAVQLLRQAKPGTAVTLVERAEMFGRGAAYGTDNPEHLLNVRAGNMGAFPDEPQHFHAWLKEKCGADAPPASSFVSRMRYGEYVADVFEKSVAAHAGSAKVSLVSGLATALFPGPQPGIGLADGRRLAFDRLALCFGNLPPAEAPGLNEPARASGHYLHDPWRARDLSKVPSHDAVLIVGSGLTMADVVQSLADQRHKGTIAVVSRHGLLPLRHENPRPYKMDKPEGSLLAMFRALRAEAKAAPARGHDWRDVIDALRPWTTELWLRLSDADRRQFLRHIRPHWEVHRHRLAPAIADTLEGLRNAGQLTVAAGRVRSIAWKDGRFKVALSPRGAGQATRLAPAWIVNCTGPQGDIAKTGNPLVRSAVQAGALRADALQLGLDVTGEGAVIDREGRASSTIFALGPPTRGAFWEVTAVPDIRRDCARMADVLLRSS